MSWFSTRPGDGAQASDHATSTISDDEMDRIEDMAYEHNAEKMRLASGIVGRGVQEWN